MPKFCLSVGPQKLFISSSGNADSKRAWCRLCPGRGVNSAAFPQGSKRLLSWVTMPCPMWKLPEWTSWVHSTLSQCCRGQGWSQLGHAEGRFSQRLTLLLFPRPPPSRSPCGLTAIPHYNTPLICLFSRATSDQLKAFHSLWLEGGRLVQVPEGLDTGFREGFTRTRSNASRLVHARENHRACPFSQPRMARDSKLPFSSGETEAQRRAESHLQSQKCEAERPSFLGPTVHPLGFLFPLLGSAGPGPDFLALSGRYGKSELVTVSVGVWFSGACKGQYVGKESARSALRLTLLSLQLGVGDSFLNGIQTFRAAPSSWNEVVSMCIEGQEAGAA